MNERKQWTGKRFALIREFTNTELNDSINRLQSSIDEYKKRNDPVMFNGVISMLNNYMAQLVAERANRIGKRK